MTIKTITPTFPLSNSIDGGFDMVTEDDFIDAIKFQLKNIILTIPGENLTDPDFGVGLITYLFLSPYESSRGATQTRLQDLQSIITRQIKTYCPFFTNLAVSIDLSNIEYQKISVKVLFEISPLKISDVLEISVES
jgi:phage baseplate assembly protein W